MAEPSSILLHKYVAHITLYRTNIDGQYVNIDIELFGLEILLACKLYASEISN